MNIGDETDDAGRFGFGWFLTGLVALNVFANLLNVIVTTGKKIIKTLKSLWNKIKLKWEGKTKIEAKEPEREELKDKEG